ncbi:MAG: sensor histidine kinase, partial [Ramlibacter sp.]
TRLESGKLKLHTSAFDLAQLTETVAKGLGTTTSRPIVCATNGPAPVVSDSGRIERVLENLIGNACRYSAAHLPIRVQVQANQAEAVVTVADDGVGIPPDELPMLFERFYRAAGNKECKGLGLGLYNSKLIVEQHGGRIWAESSPGAGSTFGFALPVARRASAPPAEHGSI